MLGYDVDDNDDFIRQRICTKKLFEANVANSYLNNIYPSWHHIAFKRERTHTETVSE